MLEIVDWSVCSTTRHSAVAWHVTDVGNSLIECFRQQYWAMVAHPLSLDAAEAPTFTLLKVPGIMGSNDVFP